VVRRQRPTCIRDSRPPAARRGPRFLHYDGDRFHEVRLIFNVVGFNTRQVKFAPTSWWDLTLPRYRGRAGMPSPFISGAAATDAMIDSLKRIHIWAIYKMCSMATPWNYPHADFMVVGEEARAELQRKLRGNVCTSILF